MFVRERERERERESTNGLMIAEKRLNQLKEWELRELITLHGLLTAPDCAVRIKMRESVVWNEHLRYGPKPYDCNTVACIGGQIALAHGMTFLAADSYVRSGRSPALYNLFVPSLSSSWGWSATGRTAAVGIERFLAGSDMPWSGPPPVFDE